MKLYEQIRKMKGLSAVMESYTPPRREFYQVFAEKHGYDPHELSYLGAGDFGEAYSTGDGKVIKQTTSKSEAEIARTLIGKTGLAFAQVYDVEDYGGYSCILMEEVDTDSNVENLFYQLQELLDQQGLPVQYADHLDMDELDVPDELMTFYQEICNINSSYRSLGIEASDVRPENMGYNKEGTLVAFDIEDRQKVR